MANPGRTVFVYGDQYEEEIEFDFLVDGLEVGNKIKWTSQESNLLTTKRVMKIEDGIEFLYGDKQLYIRVIELADGE